MSNKQVDDGMRKQVYSRDCVTSCPVCDPPESCNEAAQTTNLLTLCQAEGIDDRPANIEDLSVTNTMNCRKLDTACVAVLL